MESHSIVKVDRKSSGLLVLAKNSISALKLTALSNQKKWYRTYLAVCTGEIDENGTIDAPIARLANSIVERVVRDDGDRAVTYYERLCVQDGYSLARIHLETGRTHQIRVHMKHIGHALPGDFLYCPDYTRIVRHALHAAELHLPHPITGQPLCFTAPLPDDMRAFFPQFQTSR